MNDSISSDAIWRALDDILDPEFGVSIVDLGLIYSVECTKAKVHVIMTLTTPSCPAGSWIHDGVKAAVQRLTIAAEVQVDLVFDPLWNPIMLTPEGRKQLGWEE